MAAVPEQAVVDSVVVLEPRQKAPSTTEWGGAVAHQQSTPADAGKRVFAEVLLEATTGGMADVISLASGSDVVGFVAEEAIGVVRAAEEEAGAAFFMDSF